ncbi:GNAT family N-acetyltransferase [bacterium]|nr:GNAT family N-acetyltransferase [bacterium]
MAIHSALMPNPEKTALPNADAITLHEVDPADPRAVWCLTQYYAELDASFPTGFAADPETPASLAALRPPQGLFLIALHGAQAVGCVALRAETAEMAEVKRLWVAPDARGLGLAGRLMQRVEDHARSLGLKRLHLDTNGSLTTAIAFYRARGWADVARYNDNPYAEFWFEKPL